MSKKDEARKHFNSGDRFFQKGNFIKASQKFEKARAIDPGQSKYHYFLGLSKFNLGFFEEAADIFREVIKLDPLNVEAYKELGCALYELKKYDEAIKQYRLAAEKDPKTGINPNYIRNVLLDIDNKEKQIQLFQKTIDQLKSADAYNEWGIVLYYLKKFNDAIQQFKRALEIDPKHKHAFYNWGLCLANLKDYEKAIEKYQNAIKINPHNYRAYQKLGRALYELDKYDEAIENYKHAIEINPQQAFFGSDLKAAIEKLYKKEKAIRKIQKTIDDHADSEIYYTWADILFQMKRYHQALCQYQNAIKANRNNLAAYKGLGRALYELKKYDEAIKQYRLAAEKDPKTGIDLIYLSQALLQVEDQEKEIQLFQKTINQLKSADAYNNWGSVLFKINRFKDAILQYQKALDIDHKHKYAFYNWGLCLTKLKDYEEAIEKYQNAIKIDPNYILAYKALGITLYELEKYDESIKQYRLAAQKDRNWGIDAWNLSLVLSQLKNQDEQIKVFQKIVDKHQTADAYNNWGITLYNLKRFNQAIEQYQKAIEQQPEYHYAHINWAFVLQKQKEYPEALARYRKVLQVNPNYAHGYYMYGICLLEEKRYEDAIEQFQKAIELDPNFAYALHNIAYILDRQGKHKLAKETWKKAIQLYEETIPDEIIRDNADHFLYLGNIIKTIFRELDKAEEIYNQGLKLNPDHNGILLNLVSLNLEQKEESTKNDEENIRKRTNAHWKAWKHYRMCEKLINKELEKQKDAKLFFNLGELHLAMEENKKARVALLEAIKLDDDLAYAFAKLAVVYIREENYKKAIQYFEAALKRDPDDLVLQSNLAEAYFKAGKKEKAETEYKKILAITPYQMESLIGLGEVYSAIADDDDSEIYNDSISYFTEALKIAPLDKASKKLKNKEKATLYYSRGYAKIKLFEGSKFAKNYGILKEALEDFKQCKKYDPNNPRAERAAEKIESRFNIVSEQRLTEKIGPRAILFLSTLIFLAAQFCFFVGKPVYDMEFKLTKQSFNNLKAEKIPKNILKSLTPIKGGPFMPEGEFVSAIKKAIGDEQIKKFKSIILAQAISEKRLKSFEPFRTTSYSILTFGSLLFMIAALYLPQILKLKVGALEIEKKTVDQIKSIDTLGISKEKNEQSLLNIELKKIN